MLFIMFLTMLLAQGGSTDVPVGTPALVLVEDKVG